MNFAENLVKLFREYQKNDRYAERNPFHKECWKGLVDIAF